jgi:hypothetical protein
VIKTKIEDFFPIIYAGGQKSDLEIYGQLNGQPSKKKKPETLIRSAFQVIQKLPLQDLNLRTYD